MLLQKPTQDMTESIPGENSVEAHCWTVSVQPQRSGCHLKNTTERLLKIVIQKYKSNRYILIYAYT